MKKTTTILASICGVVGTLFGVMVWLSAGMKTVPRLDARDLEVGLPMPCLAVLLTLISLSIPHRQDSESDPSTRVKGGFIAAWLAAVLFLSALTIILLILMYRSSHF